MSDDVMTDEFRERFTELVDGWTEYLRGDDPNVTEVDVHRWLTTILTGEAKPVRKIYYYK